MKLASLIASIRLSHVVSIPCPLGFLALYLVSQQETKNLSMANPERQPGPSTRPTNSQRSLSNPTDLVSGLLQSAKLPLRERATSGLRHVPHKVGHDWLDRPKEKISWGEVVANVDSACPMQTPAPQLRVIQQRLIKTASESSLISARVLNLNGCPVNPRSLAQALFKELDQQTTPPRETIEAAIQLYLQGAHGEAIGSHHFSRCQACFRSTKDAIPRPGVYGDGKFAHADPLLELINSPNAPERSTARLLFENGTVAHLCLWARGSEPQFVRQFIHEVIAETQGSSTANSKGIEPALFLEHLMPHLLESWHFSAPLLARLNWLKIIREDILPGRDEVSALFLLARGWSLFERVMTPLHRVAKIVLPGLRFNFLGSPPRPEALASRSRAIPKDYLRIAREEISKHKVPWDVPDTMFARRSDTDLNAHDVVKNTLEFNDRRDGLLLSLSMNEHIRSFFPPHFFSESSRLNPVSGGMPLDTEIPHEYKDTIAPKTVDDAFAFYDLIKCMQKAHMLRDEDDLIETLKVLQTKLFIDSDQPRFKVATYACELLAATLNADYIASIDTIFRQRHDPEWLAREDNREVHFNVGEMFLKHYAHDCLVPSLDESGTKLKHDPQVFAAILGNPRTLATFVYWLAEYTDHFQPREDFSFVNYCKHTSNRLWEGLIGNVRKARDSLVRRKNPAFPRILESQEARRRHRIEAKWGGFFTGLPAQPSLAPVADTIKKKASGGTLTSQELMVVGEYFKTITLMPCPTKFLFLYFRAAFLELDYGEQFPIWERFRLPGMSTDVAFERLPVKSRTLKEFKEYVRARSAEIVLRPDSFQPENECDLELFALACRLYRNGASSDTVREKVFQALLPEWNPTIDGKELQFQAPRKCASVFDKLIQEQNYAAQNMSIERNTATTIDEFRRRIEALREQSHINFKRFVESRSRLFEAGQEGADSILRRLEMKYGFTSIAADDEPPNTSGSCGRTVRLLELMSKCSLSLCLEDAEQMFYAHIVSDADRRRCLVENPDLKGDVEKWIDLLEILSEGANDYPWVRIVNSASALHSKVFKQVTDVSYLQDELLPIITQKQGQKKKGAIPVQFSLTRAAPSRLIGAVCDTCALETLDNHPNKAFVAFSQPSEGGTVVSSFMGGSIVLYTRTRDGEPALVIRGLNPQLRLLKKVGIHSFYDSFIDYVVTFIAKPLNVKLILAPYELASGAAFTNRAILHLAFKARYRQDCQFVELADEHDTKYNDREISNCLIRIWSAP
jgi:hypothetical protein